MGANYSLYVETIETHAHTFLALNILAIGREKFFCLVTYFCDITKSHNGQIFVVVLMFPVFVCEYEV